MLATKPFFSPMVKNTKTLLEHNGSIHEEELYRRVIERLLYLTNTSPDINYGVQFLSQFMQSPNKLYHKADNQVLRYIKSSLTSVFFSYENNMQLKAFNDSDWASCDFT